MKLYDLHTASALAEIPEPVLSVWVEEGKVSAVTNLGGLFGQRGYCFDESGLRRIQELAAERQSDRARSGSNAHSRSVERKSHKRDKSAPDAEFYSVAEVAGMWNLSPDTIRRLFQDEKGVIPLGEANPRGKRRRVTLRIPREVVERVKRKRAKK